MQNLNLPEQKLRKNDVNWNVSGLFAQDRLIHSFIDVMTNELGTVNPISSVHGSPPLLWNSGRITAYLEKDAIDATLESYAKIGMPVYLTFSNHLIEKEDLNDKSCNYLLDKIAEGENNGVILVSDILAEYIRERHPNLKLLSSIIRPTFYDGVRDKAYYESLAKIFDCVVFLPDDIFDFPMLESLDEKEKFEVIANEPCLYGCKTRRLHYSYLAKYNKRDVLLDDKSRNFEVNVCRSKPFFKQINVHIGQANAERTRNCNLSDKEFDAIYDMGFRRFKLQGRNEAGPSFVYDLTKYMLEPEFIAPLVFKHMTTYCL